jgi:exonuclease SbcD
LSELSGVEPANREIPIMRLLHTSDWHLGQTLHDFERDYEHQAFLDWLIGTLETEQVDALLIAGDVFDHSNPSAAAQKQLYCFLTAAKQRSPHLNIVIIAGKQDTPGRLEAPAPLLAAFGATAIGYTRQYGEIDLDRLVTPLRNRAGEIAAWGLTIPFLRSGDVPLVETDGDRYLKGVELLYRQVLDHALSRRESGQALIALGHCHMTGGLTSEDSERRLVIGGAEALPVDIFDPVIAYVALGHLHRAQKVGGQDRVRYSGSPLPMSFTEMDYRHQVIRIDLDGEAVREIASIRIPRFVELLRIPAQPAPVDDVLALLAALNVPDTPFNARPYLEVQVQLTGPEPGLAARIDAALEGKPVRRAKIKTTYSASVRPETGAGPQSLDDLGRLQPDDIFRKLHRGRYGEEPSAALLAAFAELLRETGGEVAP